MRIAVERNKWRYIDLPAQGLATADDDDESSASSAIVTACSSPRTSVSYACRRRISVVCQIVVLVAYVAAVALVWSDHSAALEFSKAESEVSELFELML